MNDPTGPRADDAIMATAGIYFREGKYEDADYHYTLLRREYPRSEFQFEAHLLGLQSKLRKYQGEDYDGTPLEEAQQLVTQLRRNFNNQLSPEERDRLKIVSASLTEQQATRTMKMAKYYDGTKHYGAANTYYAEVIEKVSRYATRQRGPRPHRAHRLLTGSTPEADGVARRVVPEEQGTRIAGTSSRNQKRHAHRAGLKTIPTARKPLHKVRRRRPND